MQVMGKCYFCKTPLSTPIYRSSECPNCGKDCKICFNCTFYSKTSHWECLESISEAVREKDRANFCDFFKLADDSSDNSPDDKEDAVDSFNKLFGD